jgi:hypothetical protein
LKIYNFEKHAQITSLVSHNILNVAVRASIVSINLHDTTRIKKEIDMKIIFIILICLRVALAPMAAENKEYIIFIFPIIKKINITPALL